MRLHVLVATLFAALASLILAASASACLSTGVSVTSGPAEPGRTVTFTLHAQLGEDATYDVLIEGNPVDYTEVGRSQTGGITGTFVMPKVPADVTRPEIKVN